MAKKIVVFTGSPRKNGNTDLLAEAFIDGAEESGNEVTRFDVARMEIHGCKDCKYCFKNDGKCRQDDDMQKIYPSLRECDVLVFASPIYWFDISAQIKSAIDRMFCAVGKPFPIKESALLLVCGDSNLAVADGAIKTYQLIADYLKWKDLGIVLQGGANDKGEIAGKEGLEKARELGETI